MITFEKIPSQVETPFDYYANDLLAQWQIGVKDEELEKRRGALRKAADGGSRRRS